ncbi:imidazoleglycerol-phosphate dehydratase HisB [Desulfurivibrio dismutans]|uniref:imidazoleglycerol-phosphate dehydratase HisB n=1 Tax=Desulfurivibrio dismutans TaxID=1398908 RepID=UPI0023DC496D|nr:imidazoleglycerol-phosphate dehydratase HisB [Desulfurivibrio alkaliphilus]MDF1614571.1 imidazoleglycerol-phosphate dehydratase HisB [Desulfurivibrio alkaliphilus]
MSENARRGTIQRRTGETDINLTLVLDGRGQTSISTGVGFMDHMLTLLAVHGFFDLEIAASGDTQVDDHHTVEDLGIALGQALQQALGDKEGIARYGTAAVPMDETLARVTLDCSNRPYLHYGVEVPDPKVGSFDTPLAKEFLRAFSLHGGLTLHVELAHGDNTHHIIEAIFKALGRALSQATRLDPRLSGPLSSKGLL